MKTLFVRSLTGIVYVGLWVYFLDAGPFALSLFLLVMVVIGSFELFKMAEKSESSSPLWLAALPLAAFAYFNHHLFGASTLHFSYIPFMFMALASIALIFSMKNIQGAMGNATLAVFYLAVPLALIVRVSIFDGYFIYQFPLAILALIWANDTFAYLIGSILGRTKIAPGISPRKTYEGLLGGILGAIALSYVIGKYVEQIPLGHWPFLAVLISIASTIGDLFESKLKRNADVKDSGKIFPGHGGLLDRIDSLLFVFPMVYVYKSLFLTP
jgi:phosphatidate cytidylyltransferase